MSDNIVFPCPACGTKYSVGPHHAGKKTTCKKCGAPVTVPTPQVANPTIVGGTRTIRRADIDPGTTAEDSAPGTGPVPEVQMSGGASVLRKEETVIGAPPAVSARGPATRGPGRPAAGPAPGRAHPPMPRPAGKKNNMPMIAGIVGGAVALILVVVLVVVATSSSGGGGGPGTTADGKGGKGGANDPAPKDPDVELLAQMEARYRTQSGLTLPQVLQVYKDAKERNGKPEFKSMQDRWASVLANRATTAAEDELADIALMLDNDKYPEGKPLLEQAWTALSATNKATRAGTETTPDGTVRRVMVPNPKFVDIVTRLGWQEYQYPTEMDDFVRYQVEGAQEYSTFFNREVDQVYRDVKLFPPDLIKRLNELYNVAKASHDVMAERDKKDGFAFKARAAWLRFRQSQDSAANFDRQKGRRSFSPKAMGRETERFDNIWTYTYWRPFMVYVEKPIGSEALEQSFLDSLESKARLLNDLHQWFDTNMIRAFNLQRVKPQHSAKQAHDEGWPMEVVVLKDRATFEKFVGDVMGQPMPGVRAFYSPLDERVMTYDDRADSDPRKQWENESTLIHEAFHQLSDHYAANPMFTMEDMQNRPRYSSVLMQEGLTDSVAGLRRFGDGKNARYEFMHINHPRLQFHQDVYKQLGNKEIYRIRDALDCRNYGQCVNMALKRAREEKLRVNPIGLQQMALGIYYSAVCQMAYFFHNYKEGSSHPYRKLWWDYVGMDYKGEIAMSDHNSKQGVEKFMEVFSIRNDADWERLEKNFVDFVMALKVEDVGQDATDLGGTQESVTPRGFDREENRRSGFGGSSGPGAILPGRDEDEQEAEEDAEEDAEEELEEAFAG